MVVLCHICLFRLWKNSPWQIDSCARKKLEVPQAIYTKVYNTTVVISILWIDASALSVFCRYNRRKCSDYIAKRGESNRWTLTQNAPNVANPAPSPSSLQQTDPSIAKNATANTEINHSLRPWTLIMKATCGLGEPATQTAMERTKQKSMNTSIGLCPRPKRMTDVRWTSPESSVRCAQTLKSRGCQRQSYECSLNV